MENKANYALVGMFTLTILAIGFLLIYFIARLGETDNLKPLDVRIPGSVTGLAEGSQVLFNGIRVGRVRRMALDSTNPNMVIVTTEINGTTPVTRSTSATLGFQGLTGIAFIELKGGNLIEPNLLVEAEKQNAVARIDADPSSFNNLLATAQDIFTRADMTLTELEKLVRETRVPLTGIVNSAQDIAAIFSEKKDIIKNTIDNTNKISIHLNKSSEHFNKIMINLDGMLSKDDPNGILLQTKATLASIQDAAVNFNKNMIPILHNFRRFSNSGLRNFEDLTVSGRKSIQRIEQDVNELSQNPRRLLFGGSGTVPEYDGKKRR